MGVREHAGYIGIRDSNVTGSLYFENASLFQGYLGGKCQF